MKKVNIMLLSALFFVLFFPRAIGSARDEVVQAGIFLLALSLVASRFFEGTDKFQNREKLLKFFVVPLAGTCLLLGRAGGQEELHLDMTYILSAAAIL